MAEDQKNVAYSSVKPNEYEAQVPTIGFRHLQCLLYFLLMLGAYCIRVNLSVAIVAMVDPTASDNPNIPTYPHWTQKGTILSAFFWGYVWPQVFAGYAAHRYGAKWILIGTLGTQSIVALVTPCLAAYFGEIGMMGARAVQGFCQGFMFPSVTHLMSQWVPPQERARSTAFAFGAVSFAPVVAMPISGYISASPYGWPMIFYSSGGFGLLFCALFALLGYDSPADHPNIGQAEKYYIESNLGHTDEKRVRRVPWRAIFTSLPLYALLTTQCGFIYGFWVLLSQIPSYLKFVLNFDIKQNGFLSSLSYLLQYLLSLVLSFISDAIINKGFVRRNTARKLFNFIGAALASTALVLLGYTDKANTTQAAWLLTISVAMSAFSACGWGLNHMDLSPNFAGTLMGLCNGFSNILAILAPLSVQLLVHDQTDPTQWRTIFWMAASTQVVGALAFILFGSAEVQPWNEGKVNVDKS